MDSNAPLEPAPADSSPQGGLHSPIRMQRFRVGGLLIAIVIAAVTFAVLSPSNSFTNPNNQLGILRGMSSIVIASLGLMLVIMAAEIDLSFGYVYGFAAMLVAVLWINQGWPVALALVAAIAACVLIGLVNATLSTIVGIPSFVVTLGTGQLIFGTTLLISGAQTLKSHLSPGR